MAWGTQVKAGSAVLKNEASTRRDNSASKGVRNAVDERACVAFFVDHTEVDCVARSRELSRDTWFLDLGRMRRVEQLRSLSEIRL